MIESALTLAICRVLPVWRTMPLATLFRDSGLPSAEVALEEAKARFAIRLQTIDSAYPLVQRIEPPATERGRTAGERKAITKV